MLFPLPVADEGNNATVPRSKKPEDEHEVPERLFGLPQTDKSRNDKGGQAL